MKKTILLGAVVSLFLPLIGQASTACKPGDLFNMNTGTRCGIVIVKTPCQTGDLFNFQTGQSCTIKLQTPAQILQQTAAQSFLQDQSKQSSPECTTATNDYNQLQLQYNDLKAQSNLLNKNTYSPFANTQGLDISSRMANLALQETTALNKQTYACTGFVAAPPRIINTNCFNYGYTISCYSN